ncbi:MAG: DinB family protein [Actinomycetota bacterium]|nr:DinB family protein [Actinomycetota bacterium]
MTAIEEVVYLLDEAFAGKGIEETNEGQSLLGNLRTVDEALWRAVPPGGIRTVESVAVHVGTCKVMYDEYAFGPGRLRWDDPELQPWPEGEAPMAEVIAWIKETHVRFVEHVRDLADSELAVPRRANWGEARETRWLISMILEHDTYHAGEINHIRSLLVSNDRWKWG